MHHLVQCRRQTRVRLLVVFALVASACAQTESATDLNPEGPPMLRQVRMTHRVEGSTRKIFAFGTHELASQTDVVANVTSAIAVNNSLRLIMDELLVGNHLEEVACRGPVDDDLFGRVPVGATPEDIKRCAVSNDQLPISCHGPMAVCLCENDAGCAVASGLIEKGQPVGVLDINQDDGVDDTRFIDGAVSLRCGSFDIATDLDNSYWYPSGDQNKPAGLGFDALGPAIVLTPLGPLPTNVDCNLVFAQSVVDKEGNQVCAPPNGDITQDCQPGDVSAFEFKIEPLTIGPSSWANAQTGVSRTAPAAFFLNAPADPATVTKANVTVTEGGAPFTDFEIAVTMPTLLTITWTSGLAPMTTYVITFSSSITDTFNQGLPAPQVLSFTTGA